MRINRFVAAASSLSRRQADKLIADGQVKIDGQSALTGQIVEANQKVTLNGQVLNLSEKTITVIFNKPVGYVVSRNGQGAPTIYSLLPERYQNLKPIGRLDKDSSGLLLLSSDGLLINKMAHPSFNKQKIYEVSLNQPLKSVDKDSIAHGVKLEDGLSKLTIQMANRKHLIVSMGEGRNRQIRRTFKALGYKVTKLNRLAFGEYTLNNLKPKEYKEVEVG